MSVLKRSLNPWKSWHIIIASRNISRVEDAVKQLISETAYPHIFRFRNSKKMGKALASLILNSDLDGVSGKYFDGFKQVESSVESHDTYKALELWEESKMLVQLEKSV